MSNNARDSNATVPVQTRRERPTGTHRDDFPLLSSSDPQWRYSPVDRLVPLVDGNLDGSSPQVEISGLTSATVVATLVGLADPRVGAAGLPEERATAAAWESATSVLVLSVGGSQSEEIRIQFADDTRGPRARHIIVETQPHSSVTLVFNSAGDQQLVEAVEFLVRENSSLTVIFCVQETRESIHLAGHFARLDRDASLRHAVIALSGGIVRINPSVLLAGSGSSATMLGLYTTGPGEHTEHHVFVNHDAPHTKSNVLYKGALRSSSARSVWIGDVLIGDKATGTDSYEQNRNLILAEGARADSIPNLEIETGDIVGAGHASATGRFDEDQLFYLRSRGIPEGEARKLVVRGFLNEVAQQLGAPSVSNEIERELDRQFAEEVLV